jgi:hypothetical protein
MSVLFWIAISAFSCHGETDLNYLVDRARYYQRTRNYSTSTKLLDPYIDAMPENASREDSINMILILSLQADNFYNLGVTTRAAKLYENALKIAEKMGEKKKEAEICNTLFIVYLFSGNNSLSEGLLSRALGDYRELGDSTGVCKVLTNIGIMHYTLGDFPKSMEYYSKALGMQAADREIRPRIMINMAKTLVSQNKLSRAERYLNEALKLMDYRFDESDALQAWINKTEILSMLNKKQAARNLLDKIERNINLRDNDRIIESCEQLAQIRMTIGDSIEGLRWILKAKHLADSLNVKKENDQLREILVRYNSESITSRNKILELTVKKQSMSVRMLVTISVVVFIFAIFLIHKIGSDRSKNRLIHSQHEKIMEYEKEMHKKKEQEYKDQLDHQNRQLTTYAIDATSVSELHKIILDSLQRIRPRTDTAGRTEIDESIAMLQNYTRTELAEDFKTFFNEVHPELLHKLQEQYPHLTSNDLKLCSYIYLGMSTKEIASLTFREIRSIESSRLRLRKKLGLLREQTLHGFLHNL